MIQWRFGLDTGRRWGGETKVMANGNHGAGGDDAPLAGRAISEILDRYDRRISDSIENAEVEREERAAFRASADTLLSDVVEPTLDAIGDEVLGRGHHWSIEARVDIQSQPAIACLFRPKDSRGAASELTFRCLFPDRVGATVIIHGLAGSYEPPARSHLSSSMSAELVRKEVARFVTQVLGDPSD